VARVRIVIDQKAIDAYFRTDPVPQAALAGVAGQYMEAAREATPRGKSEGTWRTIGKGSGRIVVPLGGTAKHGWSRYAYHVRKYRGGYRVYNRSKFMHIVEYGSSNSPVYAPMRRALLAMRGGRAVVHASKSTGEHTIER
jgi:hypothetical protein